MGDLHQPLHVIDDQDQGGNRKRVSAAGLEPGNLHQYWDTEFVRALGTDPEIVAARLIRHIDPAARRRWQRGTVADWTREAFLAGRSHAYEPLPPPDPSGQYQLSAAYVAAAETVVATQLSAAGVRLALVLNRALGRHTQALEAGSKTWTQQ